MYRPTRKSSRILPICLALLASWAAAACSADRHPQSIFDPVTEAARSINDLQALIFWWIMGVLVVVLAVFFFVLIRFRDRPGAPEPRQIHGNNTLELLWTLGPAVIVAIILVPTVRLVFDSYQPPAEDAVHVHAVGHQWWWEFRYPELGVVTANQMYLPVGRPVRITLSSGDVIHNFWVPRLHGKRYNYPQFRGTRSRERENFNVLTFTIEEPGSYSGQCAEFCGASHAIMRMNVMAVPEAEFEAWTEAMLEPAQPLVAGAEPADTSSLDAGTEPAQPLDAAAPPDAGAPPEQAPAQDALVQEGYELFRTRVCAACHRVEGVTGGAVGPSLTRFGERWSIGAGLMPNTTENLIAWIKDPGALKPEAKMPGSLTEAAGFPATGLTDDEVRAVAAYLMSLR